ncbi:class I SAM-dependent RNA methyltransferase [Alteraurantiacibacter aquimixticola]|uniref:Class I SAM-dependent RNA methyltransferase n=1 Tax=Alteraurantiacibacter aquimixticola TaxID=2489173 RepID=A0A4T3EZA9_9SPHN|nr:class I SAM-dependent RNA methyltransferase [Alteraurantiacibacter aquimixticola]TIX49954.1 class I SAM-dependent RNA methyltransferase [Alteraurantiacibacter aquimixticola]
MSETEEIIRIAAKGDGVTATGQHVPGAAPGDMVADGQIVTRGPHRVEPVCRHFDRCGGCELQHCDDAALADYISSRIAFTAQSQGMEPEVMVPVHLSPPRSRRRATLHAINGGGRAVIGFREAGSHRLVDLRECHVLASELFALVEPLRAYLSHRKDRYSAEIDLTLADQGVDCAIRNIAIEGLDQTEDLLDFCREHSVARLGLDQGYGPETFWEPEPVTVKLGGIAVPYPSGSFLQATADGEAALVGAVREWLGDCNQVADLFAGLGTFAFALAGSSQVTAVEAARDAMLACRTAALRARVPVDAQHRDLFRNPLRPEELAAFDGVVIDPPRAGARSQVEQLAKSSVPRIAYVSCNPSSWARDGALLVEQGYRLAEVRPVGQFRWSTHVELASLFVKG